MAETEVAPGGPADDRAWTRCPSCLEPILADSSRCRHCGATRHQDGWRAEEVAPTRDDVSESSALDIDLRDDPTRLDPSRVDAHRGRLSSSWIGWFVAGFVAIPLGVFFAGRGSQELGTLIGGLCLIFMVVGLTLALIRGIGRMFLGP